MREWQKVKLSTIITQCQNTEKIFDMENEHYITLSSYGKGAHERIIKDGKYPVPFLGYRVRNGQFIYSRIDARNGAYDIISPELDGYVVSKDFPVYDIDTEKVLPRFLLRSVLSSEFINQVKHSSFGATNRMRIKEDVFGNYTIALPPMEQQQEIVDILDAVLSIIKSRQSELSVIDDLVKARFVELFEDKEDGHEEYCLEEIADIVSGITKGRKTKSADLREVPYMAVSNVKEGYIDWTNVKTISATEEEINQYRLLPDDVLMTEGGDPDKVGRGSIIMNPPEDCIHQNHIFRVRLDESRVLPRYFSAYLQSPKAKTYFLRAAKQTTGIASINMKQLRGLPTIVPPINKQVEYVSFSEQIDKSKVIGRALDFKPTYGYI